jgi:hypothetical protein
MINPVRAAENKPPYGMANENEYAIETGMIM